MKRPQMDNAVLEAMRPALHRYCYRMLGSPFDADDAVQDTLLRAWQQEQDGQDILSLHAWLYRIATNVCLDKLRQQRRRALPMDLTGPAAAIVEPSEMLPATAWVWPMAERGAGSAADPADIAVGRESVRLAFIALLQTLPPRQRAVVILREVFRWSAEETAAVMGTTAAAVHSALQRARVTLAQSRLRPESLRDGHQEADPRLLDRYVQAFEQFDVRALVALFHEDGSLSMPPFTMWVRGRQHLAAFYRLTERHCEGSRLWPLTVNGAAAFGQYVPAPTGGVLVPWGIHVLEVRDGLIAHVHTFIDPALYTRFGLPATLPGPS